MLKFLERIMDWWWDRPPGDDRHDFVEPPKIDYGKDRMFVHGAQRMGKTAQLEVTLKEAVESGMVVYRSAAKPTLEEALAIVKEHYHVHAKASGTFEGEHRGRSFTAAPSASDAKLMAPPDLNKIVDDLKRRWSPFLLVVIDRDLYSGAAHGWCNGSNFGKDIILELMRCSELNFRQELAKCGEGRPTMRIAGERPRLT